MPSAMTLAIVALAAAGAGLVFVSEGYTHFILALVALTAIVGVGLNVLLGLTGQVSLGHVGFYAIGAYTASILTVKGASFWLAFPAAGATAGIVGALLALPALRVTGPYLAMVTIAFAFIVHHGTVEWKDLTGGQNGLMGLVPPAIGGHTFAEREMALFAIGLAGLSLYVFHRLAASAWGKAMVAVRESETAARSVGLNPVSIKTAAFAVSAVFAGLAGAIFAPLMMFVAPDSFPFSQSILFLLAVIVGGAGWVFGPVVGAVVTVLLPELLSSLAEYRLLMVGVLLLVVLWIAPEGVIGTLARYVRRTDPAGAKAGEAGLSEFLSGGATHALDVSGLGIAFGGIKAATDVSFSAAPGRITSVIGPNGAGKTTVLNMIGGFYRPDSGSVRLGDADLAGAPAWRIARAGIARTYQIPRPFSQLPVVDNVAIPAMYAGAHLRTLDAARAEAMKFLQFTHLDGKAGALPGDLNLHQRKFLELARALASRPRLVLLDEVLCGLTPAEIQSAVALIRRIRDQGTTIVFVEHVMDAVMALTDRIVVFDQGAMLAEGAPREVMQSEAVMSAYLGVAHA
jgi:ABC-type branched-subunit amino acid transport system permease subunit/ABC-type branched-subunit amino acid transport system ATPase component